MADEAKPRVRPFRTLWTAFHHWILVMIFAAPVGLLINGFVLSVFFPNSNLFNAIFIGGLVGGALGAYIALYAKLMIHQVKNSTSDRIDLLAVLIWIVVLVLFTIGVS